MASNEKMTHKDLNVGGVGGGESVANISMNCVLCTVNIVSGPPPIL